MWCPTCRQETPAVNETVDGFTAALCCPQCGDAIVTQGAAKLVLEIEHQADGEVSLDDSDRDEMLPYSNPLAGFDSWELEQKLLHIERVLAAGRPCSRPAAPPLDASAEVEPFEARPEPASQGFRSTGHWFLTGLAWTALAIGVCGFSCGAVLSGWALWSGRNDLWTLALPALVVGQALLVLGLLLQMDVFSRRHRQTSERLSTVDAKIGSLAQGLRGRHSSSRVEAMLGAANGENWR